MHITSLVFAAVFAGFACAQTTVQSAAGTKPSVCPAQNIVDACLVTTKATLTSCGPNDYGCLCTVWTNIATCYNNCPGHPDSFGAEQSKVSFCGAASANPTSTSLPFSAPITSTAAAAATSTAGGVRLSGTATAATATSTGGASVPGMSVDGGLVALVLGIAGLVL
ncbi:hypothetical protein FGG08_001175 [Glutinoglossum americanum]|uniref:GPI anchored serine-threonine rich protein n=1 Tax=Glutinoglossum americanum TaxID=1670608 RepID=A0A9P8IBQ9_9PEZI|nr:hypothetical protein FGG08_001175 [Glutinoglossum americanum]